jgi:actin-related protein 9
MLPKSMFTYTAVVSSANGRLVGDAPAAAASHKKKSTAAAAATAAANKAAADAVAAAAADVIAINIPSLPEKEVTVGQVRHRLCEPLLRGKGGSGDTVWEGMGRAISNATMSPADKMAVWEGVVVVGETARIKCKFTEVGLS